jgi:acetyl esterase/lipase
MKLLRFSALPGFAMVLVGCSAAGVLNGITPSSSFDRDKNIAYGDKGRQTMDIYRASDPKADAPVIVFVYGGGWTRGEKGMYKFVAEGFTKEGYDVVVPDYRLYPNSVYPDMITDTGKAVNAVADAFPGRSLVLMGHSAGGYNILMTAMAPDLSEVVACDRIAGLVSLAAPTGAYPMTDAPYTTIFPDRFQGQDAPMNREISDLPPMMLINGKDDTTVGYGNAVKLSKRLDAAGHKTTLSIYDDMNHIDPVRVLSRHFDGGSTLKADILSFIEGLPAPQCPAE